MKPHVMSSAQAADHEPAIHISKEFNEGPPATRTRVQQAISAGDLPSLRSLFASLGIHPGHPEILYPPNHETSGTEPPSTNEMLSLAVTSSSTSILAFLLQVFPTTRLTDNIIGPIVDAKSIPLFRILLSHDPSVLNHEFETTTTPISMACWGSDPQFALFLLDEGADPNRGGFLALSTIGIAIQQQPASLARRLVECGASIQGTGVLKQVVDLGRVDVARVLLDADPGQSEIREALAAAEQKDGEEMIQLMRQGLQSQ